MEQAEVQRIAKVIARAHVGRFSEKGQNHFLKAVERLLQEDVAKEVRILPDTGKIPPLEAVFIEDMARRAVDKYRKDHGIPEPPRDTSDDAAPERVAFRGLTGPQAYLLESILHLRNPTAREVRDYCERDKQYESWKSAVSSYTSRIRLMIEYKYVVQQGGRYSVTELGKAELEKYRARK